jgi:hypothetical protein
MPTIHSCLSQQEQLDTFDLLGNCSFIVLQVMAVPVLQRCLVPVSQLVSEPRHKEKKG